MEIYIYFGSTPNKKKKVIESSLEEVNRLHLQFSTQTSNFVKNDNSTGQAGSTGLEASSTAIHLFNCKLK